MDDAAEDAIRQFGDQSGLAVLIEQYALWAVVGFALLFLRSSIENALAGLAIFLGSDYQENVVCWIQTNGTRRPARISQTGLLSTTFYLYEIDEAGVITGGTLLKLPNSELKSLRIERPLEKAVSSARRSAAAWYCLPPHQRRSGRLRSWRRHISSGKRSWTPGATEARYGGQWHHTQARSYRLSSDCPSEPSRHGPRSNCFARPSRTQRDAGRCGSGRRMTFGRASCWCD
mgnify:CR=1 FL=1